MSLDITPEYAKSLGRIGGQLLTPNLEFGTDIQFDTDLLYLDYANKRIGINNFGASPHALYLGTSAGSQAFRSTNLIVNGVTTTDYGWVISNNDITPPSPTTLYVRPNQSVNPIIATNGVGTANVNVTDRQITANAINADINLSPKDISIASTGIVVINGNLNTGPTGTLYAIGNVTIDGDYFIGGSGFQFGNQVGDTITFPAEIAGDLIPSTNNTYNIGSTLKYWNNVYAQKINSTTITAQSSTLGGITVRDNRIYSSIISQDVTITAPGTGQVLFNGLVPFTVNNVNNNTQGLYSAPFYLLATNDGYTKFAGTDGVIFPIGTTEQRELAVLGTTRFNTSLGYLEIFNGTEWQAAIGSVGLATAQNVDDYNIIYDLILG
jgi:hypothetical protein